MCIDTINGFVYIRIVEGHSFLCHRTPIFQLRIWNFVRLRFQFYHDLAFVKIPFQHKNCPPMLTICRPNFINFEDR